MYTFLCLFLFLNLSSATDKNLCKRVTKDDETTTRTSYYCCRGYHKINDSCIECPVGLTSENGSSCKPCKKNLYGKRCIEVCSCSGSQTCDREVGCIDVSTVYYTESTAGTGNEDSVTGQPSFTSTEQGEQTTGLKPGTSGSGYTIIYLLLIAVLVALTFNVLLVIFKHRCKCTVILSVDNTGIPGDTNQSTNLPPNEHVYHVIDDDALVNIEDINTQPREQGEQIGIHALPIIHDNISDRSNYLDSCSSSHLSDEESNDGIRPMQTSLCVESFYSDGSTAHNTQTISEYLHPYCTLLPSDVANSTYSVVKSKPSEYEIKHTTDSYDRSGGDISTDVELYVNCRPGKYIHRRDDNIHSHHQSENEVGQQMNDKDNTYINTDIYPAN